MRTIRRCLLALLVLAVLPPAGAQAVPAHCSFSGDSGFFAQRRGGVVRLGFRTFSYRGALTVCVTAPDSTRRCKLFRLRADRNDLYEIYARWSAHFPDRGAGRYRVSFAVPGSPAFTPSVSFLRRW